MKKSVKFALILAAALFATALLTGCSGGKSSYELAVDEGYTGSLSEWLESLHGEVGAQGVPGADGLPGKDGSVWYSGEGKPVDAFGKVGDFFLDFSTGDVYERASDGWSIRGSLKYEPTDKKVTVVFDAGLGELPAGEERQRTVSKGENLRLPVPVRDGYVFLGWYTGNGINAGKADDLTPFVRDVLLTARWRREYHVSLFGIGGEAAVGDQISFIGEYDGTARATAEIYLEKDGERRSALESGWCSDCSLELNLQDGIYQIYGSISFLEEGAYRVIISVEEDGIRVEESLTYLIR